jgi:hypothetical protein
MWLVAGGLLVMLPARAAAQPPAPPPPPEQEDAERLPDEQEPSKQNGNGNGNGNGEKKTKCKNHVNPNRSIGCHEFLYPVFIDTAFVSTYFGLRVRLASTTIPNLPTQFGLAQLNTVTFAENIDLGLKFTDWLGLQGSAGGRSLVGTNLPSFVYEGATFDYDLSSSLVLRLFRFDQIGTQVTLRGGFAYGKGQVASLAPIFTAPDATVALRQIITQGLGQILTTPWTYREFNGTVAVAQSLGPVFGLQGALSLSSSTSTADRFNFAVGGREREHLDNIGYRAGIAVSVDLKQFHVPVAALAEYAYSREQSSITAIDGAQSRPVNRLFGSLYYSGRPDLQLGVGGGAEFGLGPHFSQQGESDPPSVALGQMILRYIW